MGQWRLAVHGGAKEIAPEQEADNRDGLLEAVEAGRAVLDCGGAAVNAVEAAVRVLESRPAFNAGRGSEPTVRGDIELCAALMDGETLDIGGVMAVQGVCHAVSLARALLREHEILLAGPGALLFAEKIGAELCSTQDLRMTDPAEAVEASHDTVGAVAIDSEGNLAAATSTGGLAGQLAGRIGDSSIPGCGYYAENGIGAVALSGHGEAIARQRLASRIIDRLNDQGEEAITAVLGRVAKLDGDAGVIALDGHGRFHWAHNSPNFAVAVVGEGANGPNLWMRKPDR
jgi:L-asparaginase / beta-aspartyl-peptidase